MKAIIKIIKTIFNTIFGLIKAVIIALVIICLWHNITNVFTEDNMTTPGNKIEIYDSHVHAMKQGSGKYTIVLLPGMGTPSPYYDYYFLAEELSKKYQVITYEPFGYGFSDNTDKKRNLKNYEYELSNVLEFYGIKDNIILVGHSYSGLSNLNYANKHNEVKGLVCLDCTTAYQVETHVKDGKFTEEVPQTSKYYQLLSLSGITRLAYSTFLANDAKNTYLRFAPSEYHSNYRYFIYNKIMNRTIINEINETPYNELELLNEKYNEDLHVLTLLASETVESMKKDKEAGFFNQDWEEMHKLLISNEEIQKIEVLEGNHYIHHGKVDVISEKIIEMINSI